MDYWILDINLIITLKGLNSKKISKIANASPLKFVGSHPDSVGVAFDKRVFFFGDANANGAFNWWYDVESNEWHKNPMRGTELPTGNPGSSARRSTFWAISLSQICLIGQIK